MLKKVFYFFLALGVLGALSVVIALLYLYNYIRFDIEKLIYYNPKLTTQFYDRNGKLVANIFDKEHRLYVPYDKIPGRMIEAIVAIEDTSFFEHYGVNNVAIFRALLKNIRAGKKVEGASTITQQLVKNMFLTRERKISRKVKEILISLKLELSLSKSEILERYLNHIYLGHGYYGIRTASEGYFRKPLQKLSLKEIAMIVSLPKAPSFYDPTKNYEFSMARANAVLRRMKELGWISASQYKKAVIERPKVFDDTLTKNQSPYVIDAALKNLSKRFKDIKTGGYEVTLAMDLDAQNIAKEAINWGSKRVEKMLDQNMTQLNGAMIVTLPQSGDIIALVGGKNYRQSKFNRVTQSKRSAGSAIKPFIFQIALNIGYNPATKIPDIARTYEIKEANEQEESLFWKPQNYEKNTLGLITLRESLVHSRNLATINLVRHLGLDTTIKTLYHYGFSALPENLTIALGSIGINLLKFSELYSIFPNYGTRVKPRLILKVENPKKSLSIHYKKESSYLMEPKQAYLGVDILKNIVTRGTGRNARIPGLDIAGKTGTTNNFIDAWFCGFTPTTQTIVWYGNDDNTPIGKKMSGGRVSAPVFKYFYKRYLQLHPELKRKFNIPKGIHTFYHNGKQELFTDISKPPKTDDFVPVY